MKTKQQPPKRNYLLLGASLLIVGLIVELLSDKVVSFNINVVYKTLLIMFMIAVGYSFAETIILPFARGSLTIMQAPFIKLAGPTAGKPLFYITIYAALFALYLIIFIYGMDISNIRAPTI